MILHYLYVHMEHARTSKRCSTTNHVTVTQPGSPHCSTLDWNKLQSLREQRCTFASLEEMQQGSPQPQLFASPKGTTSLCTASTKNTPCE